VPLVAIKMWTRVDGRPPIVSAAELITYFAEDLGLDTSTISSETLLFSTGLIDSFALVSLMTWLEAEGGFRLSPLDVNLDNFDSVDRILAFCQRASQS
jgi:acyl carrier protein